MFSCDFVFLHLFRKTNVDDHVVVEQNSGLKVDKLGSVNGKELFKNSHYMVHTHTHTHP